MTKSILRWAGSKAQIVDRLAVYWNGERYIEPFVGSGALFFHLEPAQAILGDINQALLKTWITIRDHPLAVHRRLRQLHATKKTYLQLRRNAGKSPAQQAAAFVFLNRYAFNGLYRTNAAGVFNVPYARNKSGQLPTWSTLCHASDILKAATIVNADFETLVLDHVQHGDFVYLDPPYAVGNRRLFRQYGPNSFGFADLARLGRVLTEIDRRGANFLLSYAYCVEARVAFARWHHRTLMTRRNIAGFVDSRRKAREMLVSNKPLSDDSTNRHRGHK